jgi:hypothetical protein
MRVETFIILPIVKMLDGAENAGLRGGVLRSACGNDNAALVVQEHTSTPAPDLASDSDEAIVSEGCTPQWLNGHLHLNKFQGNDTTPLAYERKGSCGETQEVSTASRSAFSSHTERQLL